MPTQCNILAIGAHPDDCEIRFGGTAALLAQQGHRVCMLSITDGGAGHHEMPTDALIARRRDEAKAAAALLDVECDCLNIPDGQVLPTLEHRLNLIRAIRKFEPDLILTHRANDYHPDHRYTSLLVQDSAYMVAVPKVAADMPAMKCNPRFGYFVDWFNKPNPFKADVAINIDGVGERKDKAVACHASQMFEWLPWIDAKLNELPADDAGRLTWIFDNFTKRDVATADENRALLQNRYGDAGADIRRAEAFEACEYGATWDADFIDRVFGGL